MTLQCFPGQLLSNFWLSSYCAEAYLYSKAFAGVSSKLFLALYFQMNSIDAAIDRRISESRLAGRMAF